MIDKDRLGDNHAFDGCSYCIAQLHQLVEVTPEIAVMGISLVSPERVLVLQKIV